MPTFIVDASVAVKWVLREADSDRAAAFAASGANMLAPDILVIEAANALRKAESTGVVSRSFAENALAGLRSIFDPLIVSADLIDTAFAEAIDLKHPIYDCIYLAASVRLNAPLITSDAAFVAKLADTQFASNVLLLATWKP